MGKYTQLRNKLPSFVESSEAKGMAAWFAKVNAYKLEFLGTEDGEGANGTLLAAAYAVRDRQKRALEAEIEQLNIELEAISQLGIESLETDGLKKIDLAAGGSVSINDKPYTSVEDRDEVFAWIKKHHMRHLLTVNYQTLSSINNERILAAIADNTPIELAVVPGTKVFIKTKLSVRGVNAKED